MTKDEVVRAVLQEASKVEKDAQEPKLDAKVFEVFDVLEVVEFSMNLEDRFKIHVSEEEADSFEEMTFEEVVFFVQKKLQEKEAT